MLMQVYKSKTEAAKKDYLKALAAYRASLVSKVRAKHRRNLHSDGSCMNFISQFFSESI